MKNIRNAKLGDVLKIIELHERCFSFAYKKTGRKFDKKYVTVQIKNAIRGKKDLVWVLDDGGVKGFFWGKISRDYFGTEYADLCIWLLESNLQNRGIGTKVLDLMERKLREKDVRVTILEINKQSQNFAKLNGFKPFLRVFRKT